MNLPGFLIIGAMKAGTTTLYRDLLTNPAVYMPVDKEPESLCRDETLTDRGRDAYAALFARARPDQVCGEASTAYSKLPDYPGVPARARRVLGPGLKLIYLVREPISRIISQHHHEHTIGRMPADINRAVQEHPRLLDYSRYAMQARAWIDEFGPEHLMIVRFEDYVADRRKWVSELSAFIGVEPKPELVEADRVFNRSTEKSLLVSPWRELSGSGVYRRLIRPLIPADMRWWIVRMVGERAPDRLDPPSEATLDRLIESLSEDAGSLQRIMGLSSPVWDLDAARNKVLARRSPQPALRQGGAER